MRTVDRRIESRSVCLKEPKQNYPKTISRKSSPTNRKYKPRKIMAEISIISKTIRQKIYAAMCKCG